MKSGPPKRKRVVIAALVVILAYIGSYLILTLAGSYRMGPIGMRGPKYPYSWWPYGFHDHPIGYPFIPLLIADQKFWHKATWTPPLPPPFVQGDLMVVPPVTHIAFKPGDGTGTTITFVFMDARGHRFTVRRMLPPAGDDIRYQKYFIAGGDDASHMVEIRSQSAFRARVLEHMKESTDSGAARETSPNR